MDDSEVSNPPIPARRESRRQAGGAAPPAPGKAESAQAAKEEATRRRRRPLVSAIGILVIAAMAGAGYYYYQSTRGLESTDDAYIDGRAITIAPQVAGVVVSLDVSDNEFVHKGQPLIHIDRRQYDIDRESAEGALATP